MKSYDINIKVIIEEVESESSACNVIGNLLNKNNIRFKIGNVSENISLKSEKDIIKEQGRY